MGIKRKTKDVVTCDYPTHIGRNQLIVDDEFQLLYHANGQSIVVCRDCWVSLATIESILALIGAMNVTQKAKPYDEIDL